MAVKYDTKIWLNEDEERVSDIADILWTDKDMDMPAIIMAFKDMFPKWHWNSSSKVAQACMFFGHYIDDNGQVVEATIEDIMSAEDGFSDLIVGYKMDFDM